MEDMLKDIERINRLLDRVEIELEMNKEAIESIEISLRLMKAELDYSLENPNY
jgi:CRISPR/Cas system CSM-associated protein Csm2 small subunit